MIERVRYWLRNEHLGITIPVGFIALSAVWSLIAAVVESFIYPLLVEVFGEPFDGFSAQSGLAFKLFGIDFRPDDFVVEAIAAAMLGVTVYYLLLRPHASDLDDVDAMRTCPECFSEIVVEARRCAFCTAEVTPIAETEEQS